MKNRRSKQLLVAAAFAFAVGACGSEAYEPPPGPPKYEYAQFWQDDWTVEAPSWYGISNNEAKCALRWLQDHIPYVEVQGIGIISEEAADTAVDACT